MPNDDNQMTDKRHRTVVIARVWLLFAIDRQWAIASQPPTLELTSYSVKEDMKWPSLKHHCSSLRTKS